MHQPPPIQPPLRIAVCVCVHSSRTPSNSSTAATAVNDSRSAAAAPGAAGKKRSFFQRGFTVDAEFVERRKLGAPYANSWHIWGLIVSVVLSGEFSGFNGGLVYGFGSMIVAHIITSAMVMILSASFAELATTFPFSSGCAAYTFAAFGGGAATIIGYAYTLEFISLAAQNLIFLGQTVSSTFGTPVHLEPVWWAVCTTIILLINLRPRFFMSLNAILTLIACLLLVGILGVQLPNINYKAAFVTNMNDEGTVTSTNFLPFGLVGVIKSMPFTLYLYIGFETMSVCAEETIKNSVTLPRGTFAAMSTLGVLATGTLMITSVAAPGIVAIAGSVLPHATSLSAIFNMDMTVSRTALLGAIMFPTLAVSLMSTVYASSRYIYALSRGGFLPTVLALTTKSHGAPYMALISGNVLMIVLCVLITYGGAVFADFFINVGTMCALLAYTVDMIVYIRLRYSMPLLPRPYSSPFSIPGALFVIILSILSIVGLVIVQSMYRRLFIALLIMSLLLIPYYLIIIKAKLTASPEKEFVRRELERKLRDELGGVPAYEQWTGFGQELEHLSVTAASNGGGGGAGALPRSMAYQVAPNVVANPTVSADLWSAPRR
ncbi:amino acid permease-domain-containing protein [Entophlyctis helioformis]|nr:amino acid permease-domain-containing protein [Entophlyctis helioformis]